MGRPQLFNALIRTHHITSRKKVQRLRKAADDQGLRFVLLRSGGSPGIMYAEASGEEPLRDWVGAVQALRYKDYRLWNELAREPRMMSPRRPTCPGPPLSLLLKDSCTTCRVYRLTNSDMRVTTTKLLASHIHPPDMLVKRMAVAIVLVTGQTGSYQN
ncbi:hypothetical protein GGTG_07242 [Gaeumannomyces tritici R3-111a-1]|uniref:Uncharacterized protein n=1 Tax=Gaeumannomyces tritici (strain R3-111a-1) TaxID=644352 RepID=J3P145_GAET3|nr:hypothetical protein GGTG_07242 [Gaeumannomyces tritici R3-111a-1]EJT77330.1 hypothetical protein GGTG_07242 [Gaeumannomyces tritici R3-111a-1]